MTAEVRLYFEHVDWDAIAVLAGHPARPTGYAMWNGRRWLRAVGCGEIHNCPPAWACTGFDCKLLRRPL